MTSFTVTVKLQGTAMLVPSVPLKVTVVTPLLNEIGPLPVPSGIPDIDPDVAPVRVTVVTPLLNDRTPLPDPSGIVLPEEESTVAPVVE